MIVVRDRSLDLKPRGQVLKILKAMESVPVPPTGRGYFKMTILRKRKLTEAEIEALTTTVDVVPPEPLSKEAKKVVVQTR